jgi:AraC family transcriptional regulator of adaptative response/methylated-DNA-[protein]-cysteine methyltransferase
MTYRPFVDMQDVNKVKEDPRWISLCHRDKNADGRFFYAVRTTGVYCRPSCGARTPRPENVIFYPDEVQAEKAGFRPCKRCKPTQMSLSEQYSELVSKLCKQIETQDPPPTLNELALQNLISSFHLHRVFKAITGLTPKAYAKAHRADKVRQQLVDIKKQTITSAIYEAGYSSQGRFYEEAKQILGMTPKRFKSGGTDTHIRFAIGECSFGSILVAASSVGICSILMGDDPHSLLLDLQQHFPHADLVGADREFESWVAKVVGFVEAPQFGLDLPLDIRGTLFQKRVWKALQHIPVGKTISYRELAEKLGDPKASRAVAGACAANTLAVAIPCHRVIRQDGGLSGYRWGVERKQKLLARELLVGGEKR